ncbi:MAG: hypothetical protein ABIJ11_00030 [Elusimicrobiota bacterium]
MKLFKYLLVVCILFTFLQTETQCLTWHGRGLYGDPVSWTGARSFGMANCSVANEESSSALFSNPAILGISERLQFNCSNRLLYYFEYWSYPVYDPYYNYAGDTTYLINSNLYSVPSFSVSAPLPVKLPVNIVLAAGIGPWIDYAYTYKETPRDNSYRLTYNNEIARTGGVNKLSFGTSVLMGKIGLGLGLNNLSGGYEDNLTHINYTDSAQSYSEKIKLENIAGNNINFGVLYYVRNRFWAGINIETPAQLKGTLTTKTTIQSKTEEQTLTYPQTISFGVRYQPPNEIPVVATAEIILRNWSQLKDTLNTSVALQDTIEYHFGLEHRFDFGLDLRFGFYHQPWYGNTEVRTNYITGGIGFNIVEKLKLDIGIGFGRSDYRTTDPFHLKHAEIHLSKPKYDIIDEKSADIMVTLTYRM